VATVACNFTQEFEVSSYERNRSRGLRRNSSEDQHVAQ
jgi:hypothetical protein